MQQDNITLETKRIISGISKCSDVIRSTYGPAGGNFCIEEIGIPYFKIRNDGKEIMDKIKLADQVENIGANILREACDQMEKDSGDGRKTTVLLTEAILKESQKHSEIPMQIKKELDNCLPTIISLIDTLKNDITVNEIGNVAEISSESVEIGELIQKIYQDIGKDGIIELDYSNLPDTFYKVSDGVRIHKAGCLPYSYTEKDRAVWKNPKILIVKDKISSLGQINPLFDLLVQNKDGELVIYCDDIDMSVASSLAAAHLQGIFKTLIIKAPTLWKDWTFEDLAKITGATIVYEPTGKSFKNLTLDDLGTCDKIISTKDETRIIGIKDITEYLEHLEELALNDDQQKIRISRLNTKVAILKMGAQSDTELGYKTKKAKDAISASYLALKGGCVKGGGITLSNIADTIDNPILKIALRVPFEQITKDITFIDKNIIDPAIVIKNAISTAISIAGTVLTSRGSLTLPIDTNVIKNIPAY